MSNFKSSFYTEDDGKKKRKSKKWVIPPLLLILTFLTLIHVYHINLTTLINQSVVKAKASIQDVKMVNFLKKHKLDLVTPPLLNDSKFTPGNAFRINQKTMCDPNFHPPAGSVTTDEAKTIYDHYKIDPYKYDLYYLVPASLGGTTEVENVIPMLKNDPSIQEKSWLDAVLTAEVCNNKITIDTAYACYHNNWWECYKAAVEEKQ